MQIYGREVHFKRTVGANFEVAKLSPDNDPSKLGEALTSGDFMMSMDVGAKFMCALNKGYIQSQKFAEGGCDEKPLTYEELMTLDDREFVELLSEATEAYTGEKPEIETEPVKKTEKAVKAVKKSN